MLVAAVQAPHPRKLTPTSSSESPPSQKLTSSVRTTTPCSDPSPFSRSVLHSFWKLLEFAETASNEASLHPAPAASRAFSAMARLRGPNMPALFLRTASHRWHH